ncbi:MAG TPA: hypothetical protein VFR23_04185 [Jiangellaceae bacterium]|nr:hypothetical protein [Jiangellaceae bacterium]
MTWLDRWRQFAQRAGLGCVRCGRHIFMHTGFCRRCLDAHFSQVMREYADEIERGVL